MKPTVHRTGQDNWNAHQGYRHTSNPNVPLQRSDDRTPRWPLFAIIALLFAVAWIAAELRPYLDMIDGA